MGQMNRPLFTRDDAWHGGFFELLMRLPHDEPPAVETTLRNLWASPHLEGCYLRRDVEPSDQAKVSPSANLRGHTYGIATLPNGKLSACGSFWNDYPSEGSWLTLYLPIGFLQGVYDVGSYPVKSPATPPPEPWINKLSSWLKGIAEELFQQVPFEIAAIGFEAEYPNLKEIESGGVPEERWDGLLIKRGNELEWYPPTIFDPPMTFGKK